MSNDFVILQEVIKEEKEKNYPEMPTDEFFEIFSAEQVLKEYEVSYQDLENGIVGSGNDGGIDAVYAFINGNLLSEDIEPSDYKKNIKMDLHIIQSKTSNSFSETAIDKIRTTFQDLFNLGLDEKSLAKTYNSELLNFTKMFRSCYRSLATKFPELKINFWLVTTGNTQDIHAKCKAKKDRLLIEAKGYFSKAEINFNFIGSTELLEKHRYSSGKPLCLTFDEIISTAKQGYLGLVRLRNYYNFLHEENVGLRKWIFDSNVRDYQGNVEVNKSIHNTLTEVMNEDFWWLNNGVTVTATSASLMGKDLTVADAQIVNGLQTSTVIYDTTPTETDERRVLVRVIVTENAESRDKIIKSTNSQTSIPAASLRATETVHRNIEDYLKSKGLYYERRKNYYKNQGIKKDKIVSIEFLSQCIMAIILEKPNFSRARPTTLLKDENSYMKMFSHHYEIDMYYKIVSFCKEIEKRISGPTKRDFRFHMFFIVACLSLNTDSLEARNVKELDIKKLDNSIIELSETILTNVSNTEKYKSVPADKLAKNLDFLIDLKHKLKENLTFSEV